jgi:hypothetical protein
MENQFGVSDFHNQLILPAIICVSVSASYENVDRKTEMQNTFQHFALDGLSCKMLQRTELGIFSV